MTIEIKVPTFPESVQDGEISTWHKKPGDFVARDELIVEIETDKVVLEVFAPADGVLGELKKAESDTVTSNEVIATVEEGGPGAGDAEQVGNIEEAGYIDEKSPTAVAEAEVSAGRQPIESIAGPAARKMAQERGIDLSEIAGSGKKGLITKEDVQSHRPSASQPVSDSSSAAATTAPAPEDSHGASAAGRIEKRVPMTRLRKRIAERLLDAASSTAMLTTFNEVDMSQLMSLRNRYGAQFEKFHQGTRLGFMGFFVKAAAEALKRFPAVNASIDNDDIVYHGYQDIGVAVSTEKGLVVPVLRNAETMGLADIESTIRSFAIRARDGKLGIDDMTGGTFTITNGGVFGSLLSTPILNPPQTAILGMHKIQDRPMAVAGEVKILPMMYLALSYDHRLIDGKEAVQFLAAIKDMLEDPARILWEL